MNPWLSRATEKLHFAEMALEAAEQAADEAALGALPRRAMLFEAAVMHGWGAWVAILHAIAEHLALPLSDFPTTAELLQQAQQRAARSEAVTEIESLRAAGSWLHALELAWLAGWRLRSAAPAERPGMIASAGDAPDGELGKLRDSLTHCKDFLERHKNAMEEW